MIHGHTRIVLRNPISNNIIKDVEKENTFQNTIIAKFLRSLGGANTSVFNGNEGSNPLWQRALGGIFLFRNEITNNNPVQYMPPGNVMIGNGCYGVTNNSAPYELGSYSGDSEISVGSIKQIYDYSTSQAIGEIHSVCLTSQTGGYVGYGNANGNMASTLRTVWEAQGGSDNFSDTEKRAFINNVLYSFALNTTTMKMTVTKKYLPITVASIKSYMSENIEFDLNTIGKPDSLNGLGNVRKSGNKINVFLNYNSGYSVTPGNNIYYYEFNPANDTLTYKTLQNTSQVTLAAGNLSSANGYIAGVNYSGSAATAIFNSSGANIKTLDYQANLHEITSELLGLQYNTSVSNYSLAIYDPVADTIKPTNGMTGQYSEVLSYDADTDSLHHTGYGGRNYLFNSPWYLATINNLGNDWVEKTASLTMKVIYTLTEE